MAQITWKHPKPAPNPFAAVVGNVAKYAVHLCEAHAHKNEETEILASVLEPALAAAEKVKRPEACLVLFIFDAVYSILTIVVTDAKRTQDEREIFKLRFHDWDREMQERMGADTDFDEQCKELRSRVYLLLDSILRCESFAACVKRLKTSGFEFWFSESDPEADWKRLEV